MWGSARFKDWEYGGPGDEGIVVFVGVFSDEGGEDRVGSALDCPCGVEVTTKTFEANVVRTDVANVSAELVNGDEEIFRGFGRAEGEGGVGRAVVEEEEDAAVTIGWEGWRDVHVPPFAGCRRRFGGRCRGGGVAFSAEAGACSGGAVEDRCFPVVSVRFH